MAHIDLGGSEPGIIGLMKYRPETAGPLNELAEILLRGDNILSRGERELIAAHVSHLNSCHFCHSSHAAFAAAQLPGGYALIDQVKADPDTAEVTPKMRALLRVAAAVQRGGPSVTPEDITEARSAGASDVEIHDTVLIAAAFCMYNRYVDGLGTHAPQGREVYDGHAKMIVEYGYLSVLGE